MQTMTVAGKLGRDAELRQTQSGDSICSFSVAVDQRNGRDKTTNWYRCSLWGKRGESLSPYLLKGAAVTVSGEFSLSEYEGKLQLNIRVNDLALQGGRGEASHQQDRAPDGSRGAPIQSQGFVGDDLDDSIPFARNDTVW